jgi:hypothetical protein
MAMKKILTILFLLPLLVGCKEEDTLLTERDKIEQYLTSCNIVAEESVGEVIEDNPAFYSTFGRYAYRHIVNYYDAGREDRPIVEWGDKVQIKFFNTYIFSGSEPSNSAIYWSNIPEVIEDLGRKSGNTLDWPIEPLTITLGTTRILEGLERTLAGCHEADSVQVYMTSNLAYGKELIGVVPKNSMVAWYMRIEKVTK